MIGAAVAVVGLATWRAQLHGKVQYRLARRVLTATVRYREAVRSARLPGSVLNLDKSTPQQKVSYPERLVHAQQRDYKKRLTRIVRARSIIESALIEAEVVWDKPCRDPFQSLWRLEDTLYAALQKQIDLYDPNNNEKVSREEREQAHRIVFRHVENDPIDPQLEEAVNAIVKRFAPYLKSSGFILPTTLARIKGLLHG
jgi:hypothetical protein